ncbi:hypothetical protein BC834DRAFT_400421 [Gloeopeniophorella convolvens]|nr:hypothetical protein BC834DRAFT_400421 [Gloeopeniophorella convolvens]
MLHSTNEPVSSLKGKHSSGTKPWAQLPPEIIRLIATHHILDVSHSHFYPATWDLLEYWPQRMVYEAFRDAFALEKLMGLCPSWGSALEWHRFWNHACCTIDPYDTLAPHAVAHRNDNVSTPQRLSPYRHFRMIAQCSCYVCRINNPATNVGLATAKRVVSVPFLGTILTCKAHKKSSYCGLCLHDASRRDAYAADVAAIGCVENEDLETWPTVGSTCRSCRSEWIWRRIGVSPADREAANGDSSYWSSLDWEVRQGIDVFVEAGEGSLGNIIATMREKYWLSRYTRIAKHMEHALAQQRLDMRTSVYGYEGDEDAMNGDFDSDDYETLAMAEEMHSVRDMAEADWARTRILDGLWLSPADEWHGYRPRIPPAEHPAPWALSSIDGQAHPCLANVRVPPAPTFKLAQELYRTYDHQLRKILLPAMQNIIKRIMFQGRAEAMRTVATMDIEDILRALQQAWAWSKDLRRPMGHENEPDPGTPTDDASSSSKSDASHTTSPVLSTATLQTTPSPPPSDDKREKEGDVDSPREEVPRMNIFTELGPPEPSNLLHDIPYIPATMGGMPSCSIDAFIGVWRESYAPLFACSCKICERAMLHRNVADAARCANPNAEQTAPTYQQAYPQREQQHVPPGNTIRLEEAVYEEEEEEDDEEDEELTYSEMSDTDLGVLASLTDEDIAAIVSRKRDEPTEPEPGTPPKRSRIEGAYSPLTAAEVAAARVAKRGPDGVVLSSIAAGKRPRVADDEPAVGVRTHLQSPGRVGVGGET